MDDYLEYTKQELLMKKAAVEALLKTWEKRAAGELKEGCEMKEVGEYTLASQCFTAQQTYKRCIAEVRQLL